MNAQQAAAYMLDAVEVGSIQAQKWDSGNTPEHAIWMLLGIRDGYIQNEKAHRWLGYAQGILVQCETFTLENVKLINKRAAK